VAPLVRPEDSESKNRLFGVLAPHPSRFRGCHAIQTIQTFTTSMTMTNKGLQLTLPVMGSSSSTISGILNCYVDYVPKKSYIRPTHIALPLRVSYRGDGTFDRRPRFGRMVVLEKDATRAKSQTLTLTKRDTTISSGPSMLFVVEDEDRLGVVLEKTIYTVKTPVIPGLDTIYRSWKLPLQIINFPTSLADYVAAFQFSCTHASSVRSTFCVLIESRRAQQLWSTYVLFFDSMDEISLEKVLGDRVGTFQNEGNSMRYDDGLEKRASIGMSVRATIGHNEPFKLLVTVSSTQKYLRAKSNDSETRSSVRAIANKLMLRPES
jgi:hypothetical protein